MNLQDADSDDKGAQGVRFPAQASGNPVADESSAVCPCHEGIGIAEFC